ncbi:MAG: DMT family transporter [Peptostreptococcaceae bacterium]|nr:DMT family transporter [Peptostreptococcaceae bacterium]
MNLFQRNPNRVVIMAVLAASFSSIFVKLAEAPPIFIGFYRLTFALPFFAIAVLGWHRKELLAVTKRELLGSGVAGVFLSLHFLCWFTALNYTTVASATVLCLTHPIIILIVSTLLFKEKTNKKAVAGIVIALIGSAIISGGDYSFSSSALLGDFFAFCGAVFMALYLMAGKKYRDNINATVYVFLIFTSCWLVFGIEMLVTSTPFFGYDGKTFFWVFLLAIVCQIGAHAVFNWCLGYVKAIYIATWETCEVIIASLLAALIFFEIPSIWQYVGGAITILGLIYYNRHEGVQEDIALKP